MVAEPIQVLGLKAHCGRGATATGGGARDGSLSRFHAGGRGENHSRRSGNNNDNNEGEDEDDDDDEVQVVNSNGEAMEEDDEDMEFHYDNEDDDDFDDDEEDDDGHGRDDYDDEDDHDLAGITTTTTNIRNIISSTSSLQPPPSLSTMFAPPTHLMHRAGGFLGARNFAKDARRWLLVNIQSDADFACHALNRDIWGDELVESLVREGFILWQAVSFVVPYRCPFDVYYSHLASCSFPRTYHRLLAHPFPLYVKHT